MYCGWTCDACDYAWDGVHDLPSPPPPSPPDPPAPPSCVDSKPRLYCLKHLAQCNAYDPTVRLVDCPYSCGECRMGGAHAGAPDHPSPPPPRPPTAPPPPAPPPCIDEVIDGPSPRNVPADFCTRRGPGGDLGDRCNQIRIAEWCGKTCMVCTAAPPPPPWTSPPPPPECENEIGNQQCERWGRDGRCAPGVPAYAWTKKQRNAMTKCRATCGNCISEGPMPDGHVHKPPSPPPPSPAPLGPAARRQLHEGFEDEDASHAVSYTHLTLPTTPYV